MGEEDLDLKFPSKKLRGASYTTRLLANSLVGVDD